MSFNRFPSVFHSDYFRTFITCAAEWICMWSHTDSFSCQTLIKFSTFFRLGNPYIYHVLNWAKPGNAMVTVFGTLTLAILVHIFLFWVYKLRVYVQRRYFTTKHILPTKTPKDKHNKSLGSQISMVFGGDDGCSNDAFKTSSNNVKT